MKVKLRVLRYPALRQKTKRRSWWQKPKRRPWASVIDMATMDAAISETRDVGHALMRDHNGGYLLMVPIDEENVNVIPLHTHDKMEARAAAAEVLRTSRH